MNPERQPTNLRTALRASGSRESRDTGPRSIANAVGQSTVSGSAASDMSAWQVSALKRMQERATQLMQERKSCQEAQDVVDELEAEFQQAQEENARVLSGFAKEQVKRYSLLQENQKKTAAIEKEELRIRTLGESIARLEEEVSAEQDYQESFVTMHDGKREHDGEETTGKEIMSPSNTVSRSSFLEHVGHRRVFLQALESRVKAKAMAHEKQQEMLQALESTINHMKTVQLPSAQKELDNLVNAAKANHQEANHIIQYEVPSLGTRIRDALSQRAELRKALQEAQVEHDQAREIMEEAERLCLGRTSDS